jgi:hypothetical protein
MVFQNGAAVLFGGCGNASCATVLNDTWQWTGDKWNELTPATSPPPRIYSAMAFDEQEEVSILFGGLVCSGTGCMQNGANLSDTWTWNSRTWAPVVPETSPPARRGHTLTYDSRRKRVVLFGGLGQSQTPLSDTWEWDGIDWTESMPTTSPPPRVGHAMTYDSARGVSVLYGGYACADANCSGALLVADDTWEWDGAHWTQINSSAAPPARAWHSLAFDSTHNLTVLFGGADAFFRDLDDTWEWNGTEWIQLSPVEFPLPRFEQAMTYDPIRRDTVMFGGCDTNNDPPSVDGDLWRLSVFPQ